MSSQIYVAFLRGINVGGNAMIGMQDLEKAFASIGFTNIKTILASGNVVFETAEQDRDELAGKIAQKVKARFGFEITVILRTKEEIQELLAAKPFGKARTAPQTKLHVTFLPVDVEQGLKVSQSLKGADFTVLRASKGEVCSTVNLSPKYGTSDLMKVLEKQFGKKITTRTLNTVERIAKIMESR